MGNSSSRSEPSACGGALMGAAAPPLGGEVCEALPMIDVEDTSLAAVRAGYMSASEELTIKRTGLEPMGIEMDPDADPRGLVVKVLNSGCVAKAGTVFTGDILIAFQGQAVEASNEGCNFVSHGARKIVNDGPFKINIIPGPNNPSHGNQLVQMAKATVQLPDIYAMFCSTTSLPPPGYITVQQKQIVWASAALSLGSSSFGSGTNVMAEQEELGRLMMKCQEKLLYMAHGKGCNAVLAAQFQVTSDSQSNEQDTFTSRVSNRTITNIYKTILVTGTGTAAYIRPV